MSDYPDSYFVNGVELLEFRREPSLGFLKAPGEVGKNRPFGGIGKRATIVERDGKRCHYCNCVMVRPPKNNQQGQKPRPKGMMTIEHIVPRSYGGSRTDIRNMVLACYECNHSKGGDYVKCECNFCCKARNTNGYSI